MKTETLTLTDIIHALEILRTDTIKELESPIFSDDSIEHVITTRWERSRELANFDQAIGALSIINKDIWCNN